MPHKQTVYIASSPPGADVFLNHKKVGKTPLECDVKRNKRLKIKLEKQGYQMVQTSVGSDYNVMAAVDLVGGLVIFFPALIGPFFPGAKDLEQTDFHFDLTENNIN